jgi:hypothetical protein
MFLTDGAVDGSQLGARRFEIHTGREAAEELGHAVHAPRRHRGIQVVGARHDVGDNLRLRRVRH